MRAAMSINTKSLSSSSGEDDNNELRRGPWTLEEDSLLVQYIAHHGEGRWNLLAKLSGLKRTGKSCRLRWLNYLKPDVKRGNLAPEEQLLILDLHSKWGNRWSKIAQFLPGRTDNEIKNYWRTRVQKQAKHLKIDTNSTEFQNIIRCFWMPRLLQKIGETSFSSAMLVQNPTILQPLDNASHQHLAAAAPPPQITGQGALDMSGTMYNLDIHKQNTESEYCASNSCILPSESEPMDLSKIAHFSEYPPSPSAFHAMVNNDNVKGSYCVDNNGHDMETFNMGTVSTPVFSGNSVGDCYVAERNWVDSDFSCSMWNLDELWQSIRK